MEEIVEMWQKLQGQLDNTTYQVGRTQILCQFDVLRPSKDEQITKYINILIDLHKKPIWSHQTISNATMKIHLFSTIAKEFEKIIKKWTQTIPVPAAEQVVPLLKTTLIAMSLPRRLETSQPDLHSTINIAEDTAFVVEEEILSSIVTAKITI